MLPIAYPRVTVGGKSFEMRYTQASLYLLQLWNIPAVTMVEWLKKENAEGRAAVAQLQIAASTLGNIDAHGDWEPLALEPLKLAARLLPGEWGDIAKGFIECMAKVSPPTESIPAPEAKSETGNIQ